MSCNSVIFIMRTSLQLINHAGKTHPKDGGSMAKGGIFLYSRQSRTIFKKLLLIWSCYKLSFRCKEHGIFNMLWTRLCPILMVNCVIHLSSTTSQCPFQKGSELQERNQVLYLGFLRNFVLKLQTYLKQMLIYY